MKVHRMCCGLLSGMCMAIPLGGSRQQQQPKSVHTQGHRSGASVSMVPAAQEAQLNLLNRSH